MGLRWSTTLITISTPIYQAIFQRESEKSPDIPRRSKVRLKMLSKMKNKVFGVCMRI